MERKLHGWLTSDRTFFSFRDEAEEYEKTLKQYEVKISYSDPDDEARMKTETIWAQNEEEAQKKVLHNWIELWYVVSSKEVV